MSSSSSVAQRWANRAVTFPPLFKFRWPFAQLGSLCEAPTASTACLELFFSTCLTFTYPQARAKLDLGGSITCCSQTSACRACTTPVHKAKVWKEAELSWSTQSWISVWARLTTPKRIPEKWTCSSPLCAGPWT